MYVVHTMSPRFMFDLMFNGQMDCFKARSVEAYGWDHNSCCQLMDKINLVR